MIVYAVVDDAISPDFPLGDSLEVLVRREDVERFIEELRGDDPETREALRIEEREPTIPEDADGFTREVTRLGVPADLIDVTRGLVDGNLAGLSRLSAAGNGIGANLMLLSVRRTYVRSEAYLPDPLPSFGTHECVAIGNRPSSGRSEGRMLAPSSGESGVGTKTRRVRVVPARTRRVGPLRGQR